jgi:hypothetical protein
MTQKFYTGTEDSPERSACKARNTGASRFTSRGLKAKSGDGAKSGRLRWLLASCLAISFMTIAHAPAAYATCTTTITGASSGCTNTTTITGIDVISAAVTGNIANTGTISPNGISINTNSTITGAIQDSGTIGGGISVDGTSQINSAGNHAILITGPNFTGGISNGGTIKTTGTNQWDDIVIQGVSTFSGGITNTGTLNAINSGIVVQNVNSFTNGITNSGMILGGGSPDDDIYLGNISSFSGNLSNNGTISGGTGIYVDSGVNFAGGGIVNSGTITGTGGTAINASNASSPVSITESGGTINGAVLFSTHGDTLSGYGTINNGSTSLSTGNATIFPTLAGTGVLSVTGTGGYTQGSLGTLQIEVSPTTSSKLAVTGMANLGGTLALVFDTGVYSAMTYDILDAAGGVSGTFASLTGTPPAGFTDSVIYLPNEVELALAASGGGGGGSSVPEPPAWLTFWSGLLGFGYYRLRRQRVSAFAEIQKWKILMKYFGRECGAI